MAFAVVPLSPAAATGGWAAATAQVGGAAADGALLVQPVPEGEGNTSGPCLALGLGRRSSTGSDGATGYRSTSSSQGPASDDCADCAGAVAGRTARPDSTPVAEGRIGGSCDASGGCCHEADGSGSARFADAAHPLQPSQQAAPTAQYYGVVVMAGAGGSSGAGGGSGGPWDPEGCYLLKTTHMAQPLLGCSCSQYVLTRVAKGPPLQEQLTRSWLV